MRYETCLEDLYSLVDYERLDTYPREFNLDVYRAFLKDVGDPQKRVKNPIIITGTKGKGSTAEILASCLKASGRKVGIFTSPHLVEVRERIRVSGERIPEDRFSAIYERFKPFIRKGPGGYRTVFEVLTAMAFEYFLEEKADYAILEVGMGGRDDATNVADSVLSIITPVSLDHTHVLGRTISEIADNKMGVARRGKPLVSAPQCDEALRVIEERCRVLGARLALVGRDLRYEILDSNTSGSRFRIEGKTYTIPLAGEHQVENAAAAYLALKTLGEKIVSEGFSSVSLRGRLQVVQSNPIVIVDTAHNAHSANVLASSIKRLFSGRRVLAVVGMLKLKDHKGFASELSSALDEVFVTKVDSPRSVAPEELAAFFRGLVPSVTVVEDGAEAFERARTSAGMEDIVLVTGSFYLVGDVLKKYGEK
jgi:dihydrofolate synthase/folylpolyglutamate synthase